MSTSARKTKRLLCFVFCALLVLPERVAAMKDCIEPLRVSNKDSGTLTCSPEFALVPEKICDNDNDTTDPDCRATNAREGSQSCAVVAEALFAEWRMMDGALLASGSCRAGIDEGRFFHENALEVFPDNDELVAVHVLGKELRRALERGLVGYYVHGHEDAYPHTAGLRFALDLSKPEGQRVQDLERLGYMCNWKPMEEDREYMILTLAGLAKSLFPTAHTTNAKRRVADAFFLYATSVCTIRNNWHQMRLHHSESVPAAVVYPMAAQVPTSPPSSSSSPKSKSNHKRAVSASRKSTSASRKSQKKGKRTISASI